MIEFPFRFLPKALHSKFSIVLLCKSNITCRALPGHYQSSGWSFLETTPTPFHVSQYPGFPHCSVRAYVHGKKCESVIQEMNFPIWRISRFMHISNRQPTASPFSQRVKKLKRVNVGAATPIRYLKCIYYIPSHHIAWHHIDAAV